MATTDTTAEGQPVELKDVVTEWLNQLNRDAGSSFEIDAEGISQFGTPGGTPCMIEAAPGTSVLYFTAQLMELKGDEGAEFYRRALEKNLFGQETMGASVALHPGRNTLLLCYMWPMLAADYTAFVNLLAAFSQAADAIRSDLGGAPLSPPAEDESALQGAPGALRI